MNTLIAGIAIGFAIGFLLFPVLTVGFIRALPDDEGLS